MIPRTNQAPGRLRTCKSIAFRSFLLAVSSRRHGRARRQHGGQELACPNEARARPRAGISIRPKRGTARWWPPRQGYGRTGVLAGGGEVGSRPVSLARHVGDWKTETPWWLWEQAIFRPWLVPKFFPTVPVTSNHRTHAWNIKCNWKITNYTVQL